MTDKPTLLEETRTLLNNRPVSLKTATIAEAVGMSSAWVNYVANGAIDNPGFKTLLKLNEFLKYHNKTI